MLQKNVTCNAEKISNVVQKNMTYSAENILHMVQTEILNMVQKKNVYCAEK